MNKSSSAALAAAAAETKNTSFPKIIDIKEAVTVERWKDKDGHSYSKTTVEPSKKGAIAGAAAGGAVAGPAGAVVGGILGAIFGPADKPDDKNGKKGA